MTNFEEYWDKIKPTVNKDDYEGCLDQGFWVRGNAFILREKIKEAFEAGQKSAEREWFKYSEKKPPYKSEESRTDKGITTAQEWFLCAVKFGASDVEIMPLQWDYDKKRFEFMDDSDYDKKVVAWQPMPGD